eukprot:TRINITY_DN65838_c0_g1_i1.p1 TRINITY_DN65838_c0_g1~~TRINITY_DN65838_c0_g1_i1.p1  ORF type:complete len:937 (-),score=207.58 TRINITY_DN65838_c0_g1_i1:3-2813(-)
MDGVLPELSVAASFASFRGERLKRRVAVLSVEEELRGATCWVLELLGCSCARGFASAEQLAESLSGPAEERWNVVLCDLELAEGLLHTLGKTGSTDCGGSAPLPPVVLVCPKRMDKRLLSRCLQAGACSYVAKPLRVQAIRGVLLRHGVSTEEGEASPGGSSGGRYERVRLLGNGSCGEVSLVKRRRDSVCFALKQVPIANLGAAEQQKVLEELRLHKAFNCPCVVRYYTSWMEEDTACLLLEYVENGSLSGEIRRCQEQSREIPDSNIVDWAGQIILGLLYLHRKEVVHRDLKSDNLLGPDAGGCVKIADFGISKRIVGSAMARSLVGTLEIMAPERLRAVADGVDAEPAEYGPESDLWSLGVVLYELAMLRMPFSGDDPKAEETKSEALQVKQERLVRRICNEEPAPLPFSRAAVLHKVVLGGLLQKQPGSRPSAAELCRDQDLGSAIHRFLKCKNLLSHPSILEVVDVLPSSATEGSCIASSDLDVISFRRSRNNSGDRTDLAASGSLYLDHSRLQISELGGLLPRELVEVFGSEEKSKASQDADAALLPQPPPPAKDTPSSDTSKVAGNAGYASQNDKGEHMQTEEQEQRLDGHHRGKNQSARLQRQLPQSQLELSHKSNSLQVPSQRHRHHSHKTSHGHREHRQQSPADPCAPPPPPSMPPPPQCTAWRSMDKELGRLKLSLPVPDLAEDDGLGYDAGSRKPRKSSSRRRNELLDEDGSRMLPAAAVSHSKQRHRSRSGRDALRPGEPETPWSAPHCLCPSPPSATSTSSGDRFLGLGSSPPSMGGLRHQRRASSAGALLCRSEQQSLPLSRRNSRSKLDPLDSPPKALPHDDGYPPGIAAASDGFLGRPSRSRSAAALPTAEHQVLAHAVAPQEARHGPAAMRRLNLARVSPASSAVASPPSSAGASHRSARSIESSRQSRSGSVARVLA